MFPIKLYNYLSRKIEKFKPIHKGEVFIYACGPTVYDFVHIGNLRTFIFEDILKRTFEYFNYKTKFAMNITDIDDKIIKRAKRKKTSWRKLARKYERYFFKNLKELNIEKADFYPRASCHIKEMIELIKKLEKKGIAYETEDGVYFDISKYPKYGVLVDLKKIKEKKSRILADEYQKEEIADFALWKFKKKGEPFWQSPWGEGRPGWHIECSTMSMKYLDQNFDIHCGGIDLLFPHHENEIAQSQAATGKKFVNFFLEGEHLLVGGKKMSKKLGNFYNLTDLKRKGFLPLSFRYLILQTHYQKKLNFTFENLEKSQKELSNLWKEFSAFILNKNKEKGSRKEKEKIKRRFEKYLSSNLDIPKAINIFKQIFKNEKLSDKDKVEIILDFDKILGLSFKKIINEVKRRKKEIKGIKTLIKEREIMRRKKEWKKADKLREKIEKKGYLIEDLVNKTRLKFREKILKDIFS